MSNAYEIKATIIWTTNAKTLKNIQPNHNRK